MQEDEICDSIKRLCQAIPSRKAVLAAGRPTCGEDHTRARARVALQTHADGTVWHQPPGWAPVQLLGVPLLFCNLLRSLNARSLARAMHI